MSRRKYSNGTKGFTLIEALVALAIIAAVLSSIGAVIGVTVKGTRAIDQRLALTGAAETVFAALPDRKALKPGRQSATVSRAWCPSVTSRSLWSEGMSAPSGRSVITLSDLASTSAREWPARITPETRRRNSRFTA